MLWPNNGMPNNVVSLLEELIRIPSPSSLSNRPIVEYAAEIFDKAGWGTTRQSYRDGQVEKLNLIAVPSRTRHADREVDLLFVCHTDTVPYLESWKNAVDPYVADGFVHGCGACDVKGFLACLLSVVTDLNPANLDPSIAVALTADEEIGCIGASKLVEAGIVTPKHVLIGEPTSLKVGRAGKGYCLAEITILGREAHSAYPSTGASAVFRAAKLVAKIEEIANNGKWQQNELFDPPFTTVNIGLINGGTAKNIVPGECRLTLECRPIPGEDVQQLLASIRREAEVLQGDDQGSGCEIKTLRNQLGFCSLADSMLATRIERLTGRSSVGISFGSEANVFSKIVKDVVVFGPGDMRTAHSNRECISITELDSCALWLRDLFQSGLGAG